MGSLFNAAGDNGGTALLERVHVEVNRETDTCFIEFVDGTPMPVVMSAMQVAERMHNVGWDLLDGDLWEYPNDESVKFRIHGFFIEDC